jgi:hypothetical protein
MSAVRRGDIVQVAGGEASEWVGDALEGRGEMAATEGNAGLGALCSSDRMLDLASRLRRDLQTEGVVISEMGKASSGQHTVMTLRLPSGAKSALEQVDARLQVSISFA